MLSVRHAILILSMLALMLYTMSVPLNAFAFGESDASLIIAATRGKIIDCYDAASEAEKAGANVTALLGKLDDAGKLLSKAELALRTGDFNSSYEFALGSQAVLNSFIRDASILRDEAKRGTYQDFWVNVVGSLVGAGAVVVGSFLLWVFLKRRQVNAGSLI